MENIWFDNFDEFGYPQKFKVKYPSFLSDDKIVIQSLDKVKKNGIRIINLIEGYNRNMMLRWDNISEDLKYIKIISDIMKELQQTLEMIDEDLFPWHWSFSKGDGEEYWCAELIYGM